MSISDEVLHSKEFKAFKRLSSEQETREVCQKTDDELKTLISTNATHEKEVDEKMKQNAAYKDACEVKKDFESARRDRLKSTKAATKLAVLVLHERKKALRSATRAAEATG